MFASDGTIQIVDTDFTVSLRSDLSTQDIVFKIAKLYLEKGKLVAPNVARFYKIWLTYYSVSYRLEYAKRNVDWIDKQLPNYSKEYLPCVLRQLKQIDFASK